MAIEQKLEGKKTIAQLREERKITLEEDKGCDLSYAFAGLAIGSFTTMVGMAAGGILSAYYHDPSYFDRGLLCGGYIGGLALFAGMCADMARQD